MLVMLEKAVFCLCIPSNAALSSEARPKSRVSERCTPLLELLNNSQNAEGRIGPGLLGLACTPLSDRPQQDFSCEFRTSLGFEVRTLMSQNNGR